MLSNDTHVPELISSLSEFDILAPQRYCDQWQGTSGLQPEKSLMLVVLLNAVECFQKYALLRDEYTNRVFRDTEDWIFEDNHEWPFAFINICEALGIDRSICAKVSCQAHRSSERTAAPVTNSCQSKNYKGRPYLPIFRLSY